MKRFKIKLGSYVGREEGGFMRLGQSSKFTIFMTFLSKAEWQSPLTLKLKAKLMAETVDCFEAEGNHQQQM